MGILQPNHEEEGTLDGVAFGADDATVAVCGSDPNSARLLNVTDGAERQSFDGHTGR